MALTLPAILFSLLVLSSAESPEPDVTPEFRVVMTPKGAVRGSAMTSRNGVTIYAFRGLRYAQAPVGELRFKAPVPYTKDWNDVLNATEDGPSCYQGIEFFDGPFSEDCLFLNVFTTKLPTKVSRYALRPVIVWLHPGAWFAGTGKSNMAGPQYLLDEDVVFVSINYRLGALGFLSTGDSESPGNYALKDQVVALQWVHDNIESFGGDPNLVTLYGSTSGAASAQYHMLSSLSAGLFHRVISSSGSCLCSWALNRDPLALAKRQAELLDCPHDDKATSKEIVDCLRTKDADEISKTYTRLREWNMDPFVIYSPVVESGDSSDHPFLKDIPEKIIDSGTFTQVPVLSGIIENEMIEAANGLLKNETLLDYFIKNFEHIVPYALYFEKETSKSKELTAKIKEFYFHDEPITKDSLHPTSDMYSDAVFLYGVDKAVKLISKKSKEPVYYYFMNYKEKSETNKTTEVQSLDDLKHILYSSKQYPLIGENDPDYPFSQRLVKIWVNFAKTGNPTPERDDHILNVNWLRHTPDHQNYLEIGSELKMGSALQEERANFWETIYSN